MGENNRRCDKASEIGVTRLATVRCPTGLAFDIERQTCDWKTNVKNCEQLESKRNPFYLPPQTETIPFSAFTRCTRSGLKQITCPSGLAFDLDKQTCDWKGKVTNCDKLESKSQNRVVRIGAIIYCYGSSSTMHRVPCFILFHCLHLFLFFFFFFY